MRTLPLIALLVCALGSTARAAPEDDPAPKAKSESADAILGTWHLLMTFRGEDRVSKMVLTQADAGALKGVYTDASGSEHALDDVTFTTGILRFYRLVPGQRGEMRINFQGTLADGVLTGNHVLGARKIPAIGTRTLKALEAIQEERRQANVRGTDVEADYDKHARKVMPRDGFPVLFDPALTPAAEAEDIRDDEPVIGISIGDEAKAYPISIMGVHELVNDTCGGQPIAASW